jgi:hypothetical protein
MVLDNIYSWYRTYRLLRCPLPIGILLSLHLRQLSLSLLQVLGLWLEGPLLIGQGVGPKVAFVHRDDHHSFDHELCEQSHNPESLLIKARVSVL